MSDGTQPAEVIEDGRWVIELVPMPSSIPAAIRVRQALKSMLRGYKLRAVLIRSPSPSETRPPVASDEK